MTSISDRVYLAGFLLGAVVLLLVGRNLLPESVLVTWGLTFGATTAVAAAMLLIYHLQGELRASRSELARKNAELEFALEVQQGLFPRTFPRDHGLEFAAFCIPARGLGGDYYDVMTCGDGRLIFALADASGKGVSAALLMANLQALLRAQATTGRPPAEICRQLNSHLYETTDASKFATLFCGEWDPSLRRLRYVNAGHHRPLIVGAGIPPSLGSGGFPLGLFADSQFQEGEAHLSPGDLLVLFSDGLTEAGSRRGEEFGTRRLEQIVRRHRGEPLQSIQENVLEAVHGWARVEPEDDMTLLMARVKE